MQKNNAEKFLIKSFLNKNHGRPFLRKLLQTFTK